MWPERSYLRPDPVFVISWEAKPYGTLRTNDIEGSDVEDMTLRTGDFEERQL